MKTWIKKCNQIHILILGILVVTLGFLPFLILKGNAPIYYQDQLDGEIFTYIFNARHLFSRSNTIPEIMGGLEKTALMPPSFLGIGAYLFLPPLAAFLLNYYFVVVIAYVGMFLLLQTILKGEKEENQIPIAFFMHGIVALLFAFLPHYTVYGLSIAGIPWLLVCLLHINSNRKNNILPFLGVFIYGISSSFVLVGFAVVAVMGLYFLWLIWKKEIGREIKRVWAMAMLLAIYICCNTSLFGQVLGLNRGKESHKEELVLYGMDFFTGFKSIFLQDTLHAASLHKYLIIPVIVVSLMGIFLYKKSDVIQKKYYRILWSLLGMAVGIACFYGFFHWYPVVTMRNQIGGFVKYFQLDRFYWFYPVIWYVMLALMITILYREGKRHGKIVFRLTVFINASLLVMMSFFVLQRSDFKKNVYQIVKPATSNAVTWNDFYGTDVMEQVKDFIGKPQDSYRVASLGLQPAPALFNGFYTIDGYSNNYSLEYKHEFRKIIEKELEKDESMRLLFDQWGNRCYLFTSQIRDILVVSKENSREIECPELNVDVMKQMNCEYIISAVKITNPEKAGLIVEGEFETEQSFYKIWLYRLP